MRFKRVYAVKNLQARVSDECPEAGLAAELLRCYALIERAEKMAELYAYHSWMEDIDPGMTPAEDFLAALEKE